jgi:hypothetical protein
MWLVIEPMRINKTARIMYALRDGSDGKGTVVQGMPQPGPFVIWGHRWLSERLVPRAINTGTEWWLIDNGFHLPARGAEHGYYALTRNGTAPVLLDEGASRIRCELAPWRKADTGYVLIAQPGEHFGRMLGIDTRAWAQTIVGRVRQHTKRRILVRDKTCRRPLEADLAGAFVLVTHSSKVAVDAVKAGVPVIVEPTSPAAPVGSTDLADIDNPPRPDRDRWFASLLAQQFTLDEMRSGLAWAAMERVRDALGPLHR